MKSYIIKNCPAIYINHNNEYDCDKADYFCQDCTDCVMKRIADKCKAEKDKGFVMSRYGFKVPVSQGYDLACDILSKLEIEECE